MSKVICLDLWQLRIYSLASKFWEKKTNKQEDHDGPISLTWANRFAYLLLKFQPSSLLWIL